jgi:hypothetical protein
LYFTFRDKWKKTESPQYHELFESKTELDRFEKAEKEPIPVIAEAG